MRDESFAEAVDRKTRELLADDATREALVRRHIKQRVAAAITEERDKLLALDRPLTADEARTLRTLNSTLSTAVPR